MKRFLILFLTVVIVVSSFAITAFADSNVNGRTVLNYLDYVTAYDLFNPTDGWVLIDFGADRLTSYKNDINGFQMSNNGTRVWSMKIPLSETASSYVGTQFPGGASNSTFLDLSNVPNGSRINVQAICESEYLQAYQTELVVWLNSGVSYYDSNFNHIRDQASEQLEIRMDTGERMTQIVEITLDIPENASYCTFYSIANIATGRTNDVSLSSISIEFQFSRPNLKIATSYTQIIINGIVNARPPEGGQTIIGVDDLEQYLQGATGDGKVEAERLFASIPDILATVTSAMMFMAFVFNSLAGSTWISSILAISLALGVFAFVCNIVADGGNKALDAKSAKGKQNKGG